MKLNLPSQVRAALYVIIAVSSPVVTYLGTEEVLSKFWVGLFSVVVTAVSALALANVTPEEK